MTNFTKILILIAVSLSLSGCGIGNKPPTRKSKGTQVKPVNKPGTPPASTSKDAGTTPPNSLPTANTPGEIIGMWQELLMDPMPAYEDNFRTVTWRINKHKIIRTAHCTLDGNPVELEVISPSDTVDNQIDIKEDHKKDKMDSKGEKICDVALTKGPIGFALVDGVLVLRFGKETLFLKRFKATAPVATADVQP